ncbi:hypothetical protein [uncultured Paludibaculum sp.]|uniref:hypothetical protein n=1 Tax=uncultured Paludibaculum sp. TaxID=1765020 RepID=UPI002AAA8F9D|nr:hypothetical protein [uncultured Paludibaculum sp.]
MRFLGASLALSGSLLLSPLWADFTYQQKTQITGGTLTRMMKMVPGGGKALEPTTSTVYLKGNRMATVDPHGIHIVDLDKETMTDINLDKKTFSVITFAEFGQAMEAMQKRMSGKTQQTPGAEMNFKMDVQKTGQVKVVSGLSAQETLLKVTMETKDSKSGQTGAMNFDSDMWMAKDIPGYDEVKKFHTLMAQKLAYNLDTMKYSRMAMQPGMGEGMAKLAKEASKLEGIPVYQVMKMQGMGGPGGMPQQEGPPPPTAGEVAQTAQTDAASGAAGRATGGRFGGLAGAAAGGMLGGFGRKKKQADPPPAAEQPQPAAQPQAAGPQALMEITTEWTSFSSGAVDTTNFTVPAGFKEVESDMKKAIRESNK